MSVPSPDTPENRKPVESFDELVSYLEAGCKPPEEWRIGTEHEKFGFRTDDLSPLPYDGDRGVRAMLEGMQSRFGWDPGVIQLRNVGTEGFEARFREWVYIDFLHRFPESFPYLVVPAGRRELADGTIIEAGRFPISGTGVDNDAAV